MTNLSTSLRIAPGLTASEHRATHARMVAQGLTGLTLSNVGGAYGPTWPSDVDADLSFLRFYPGLRSLELGLPAQGSLEALLLVADSLETLTLGETARASLLPVARCERLRNLAIVAHRQDRAALASLTQLQQLDLRQCSLDDHAFVRQLKGLRRLFLGWGPGHHLELVRDLPHLERLCLCALKGLRDLDAIGSLPSLQVLQMEQVPLMQALPVFHPEAPLRAVLLDRTRSLRDLSSLAGKHLDEFLFLQAKGVLADVLTTAPGLTVARPFLALSPRSEDLRAKAWMPRAKAVNLGDLQTMHSRTFEPM